MKRASLVKAGEALSPDAFKHVLASENDATDPSAGKGPPTVLSKLAGRAAQFNKAISKAAGHLNRLEDENDQERYLIYFHRNLATNTRWSSTFPEIRSGSIIKAPLTFRFSVFKERQFTIIRRLLTSIQCPLTSIQRLLTSIQLPLTSIHRPLTSIQRLLTAI